MRSLFSSPSYNRRPQTSDMRSNILVLLAMGLLALAGCRSQGYYDSLMYDSQPSRNVPAPVTPAPEEQEDDEAEEARREAERAKREAEEARRIAEEARRDAERLQREIDEIRDGTGETGPSVTGPPVEQETDTQPPEPSRQVKAALTGLGGDLLDPPSAASVFG